MAAMMTGLVSRRNVLSSISQNYKFLLHATVAQRNFSVAVDNDENYDIIITGGGMVGTTLACAIANNRRLGSKKTVLLEGGPEHRYERNDVYSNRVVALNQQTRTLLSSIGAWKHIEAERYAPVRKMQVWDACSDAMIAFNEDYLADEIAYIVENQLLLHAVNEQLKEMTNVDVVYNARVEDIILPAAPEDDAQVKLTSGKIYKAPLLIGADGVNSKVRQAMGVQYVKWEYDQIGIVATLQLSEPTENTTAWQRFLPTGPIALLPLTDSLSSLVWSVNTSEGKRLVKLSDEEFLDTVNDALWKIYPRDGIVESGMKTLEQLLAGLSLHSGAIRQLPPSVSGIITKSRAAFPLGFGHSVSYVRTGTVLIGDAAHRVHPLAGQGVNLGFGDVTTLVQILAEMAVNGALLGDAMFLRKYETLRQRHNIPTMLAIDALHRLYKGTAAPIVLARSLGLQLTNALPMLKKALLEHASGEAIRK